MENAETYRNIDIISCLNKYKYSPKEKQKNIFNKVMFLMIKMLNMFEYKNLPETMPKRNIEMILLTNGASVVTEVNGKLYMLSGSYGGELNEYYEPTSFIVSNPYLKYNKNLKIEDECILVRNDSMNMGIMPILEKYAYLSTENDLTMDIIDIMSRYQAMIQSPDAKSKKSAEKFIQDIENGKYSVVASNSFLEGVKVSPLASGASSSLLKSFIEYEQYLKGSLYNDLGLNAQYNMKREFINEAEISVGEFSLLPFIDDMLNNRKECFRKVNEKYGTNIEVSLSSGWELQYEEISKEIINIEETNKEDLINNDGGEDNETI